MANQKPKYGLDAFESTHNALFAKHPDANVTAATAGGSRREGLFNGNSNMKGEPAGGHLQEFLDFSTFSNESTSQARIPSLASSSRAINDVEYLFMNEQKEENNTTIGPVREINHLNRIDGHVENTVWKSNSATTSAFSRSKTTEPSTGPLTANMKMNKSNATRSTDAVNNYEKERGDCYKTQNGAQIESKGTCAGTCAGTLSNNAPGNGKSSEATESRTSLQSHASQEIGLTKRGISNGRLQIDTSAPPGVERISSYDSSTKTPVDGTNAEIYERPRASFSPSTLADYTPVQPNRQQELVSTIHRTLGLVQSAVGPAKENMDPKSAVNVDANANIATSFATPGFRLSTRKPTRRLGLGPPKRAPLSIEEGEDVEPSPLVTAQMRAGLYGHHPRPTVNPAHSATSSIPKANSTTPPANLSLKTPRSDPVPSASSTERLGEQKLAHLALRCESESPSGRFDESVRNGTMEELEIGFSALKGRRGGEQKMDNAKQDQNQPLVEPGSSLATSDTGNCEKLERNDGDGQSKQASAVRDIPRFKPRSPTATAFKVTEISNESGTMSEEAHGGGTMPNAAATLPPHVPVQSSIQPQPQSKPWMQKHVEPAAPVPTRNIVPIVTTLTNPKPAPSLLHSNPPTVPAAFHPQLSDRQHPHPPTAFNTKPPPTALAKSAIHVNNRPFNRLEVIGRGGSSKVYKVMAPNNRIFALKRVSFDKADSAAIAGYINEINLLKRLSTNERIIRLYDAEVNHESGMLLMVMECGEIDLAHVLQKQRGKPVSLNFVRLYWEQMLQAVQAIHEAKIVHSDLKPANFLFVEGSLKLIDFGIAKSIPNDTTNVLLDQQVGTVNYMSPEAILDTNAAMSAGGCVLGGRKCMKMGRPSDVWSLGCILYQMVYARTPFAHLTMYQKLQCIPDPVYPIAYPPTIPSPSVPTYLESMQAMDVAGRTPSIANTIGVDPDAIECMRRCLERDAKQRITIPELLVHRFLKPEEAGKGIVGSDREKDGIYLDRRRLEELVRAVGGWADGGFSKMHDAEEVRRVTEILHGQLQEEKELQLTCIHR